VSIVCEGAQEALIANELDTDLEELIAKDELVLNELDIDLLAQLEVPNKEPVNP
jgi:hypothetical protein